MRSDNIVAHLILNGNGGTWNGAKISTISLMDRQKIEYIKPTRPGYTFSHWTIDEGVTPRARYDIPDDCRFTGDKYLYAEWDRNEYEVRYHSNNGEYILSTESVMIGDTVHLLNPAYTYNYHTFKSWSDKDKGYSKVEYTVPRDILVEDLIRDLELSDSEREINLYARWQGKVVTIRFNANAVDATGYMANQIATYGVTSNLSNNLYVREGYELSGWATSSTADRFRYLNKNSIKKVIEDNADRDVIDLYGVWASTKGNEEDGTNEYVWVHYNPNLGKIAGSTDIQSSRIGKGDPFTKVDAEREGYELIDYQNEYGDWIYEGTPINVSTLAIAEWQDNTYHLYYVGGNSATAVPGEIVTAEGEVDGGVHDYSATFNLKGAVFTRPGYYIASWSGSERAGSEIYELGEEVSKLTTGTTKKLYALWRGNNYEIRYVGGAGATGTIAPTDFTYGDKTVLTSKMFTRPGMVQTGWKYTNSRGDEYTYGVGENNQIDTSVFDAPLTTGYIELTALFGANSYRVRLDANGGQYSDGTTEKFESINYGESTSKFERPDRRGYKFNYYIATSNNVETVVGNVWNFTDVNEIIASYSGIKYYVEYDGNGGVGNMPQRDEFIYGTKKAVRENIFTNDGRSFLYWETDNGRRVSDREEIDDLTDVDGKVVLLRAKWGGLKYNIEYRGNGADNNRLIVEEATYGEAHKLRKNDYEKFGYEFKGWSRATNCSVEYGDEAIVGINGEKYENPFKLYASWVATKSVVGHLYVHGNGGLIKGLEVATISLVANEPIVVPDIVRVGYKHIGYIVPSGAGWTTYDLPEICIFSGDKHIYADWDNINYSIVYNSNNGEVVKTTISNILIDDTETIRSVESLGYNKLGYISNSWSNKERGIVERVNNGETLSIREIVDRLKINYKEEVINLYGNWEGKRVTIRFNANATDATGVMDPQVAEYDGAVKKLKDNSFKRSDYTFGGWATESSATKASYIKDEYVNRIILDAGSANEVDLYAIWIPNSEAITVTYYPNGGEIGGSTDPYVHPIRRGEGFTKQEAKWKGRDQGEYVRYDDKTEILEGTPIYISTEVEATWSIKRYKVVYDGRGGTPSDAMKAYEIEHDYTDRFHLETNHFDRAGYTFRGWSKDSKGTNLDYIDCAEVSELTEEKEYPIYALWGGNSYEIVFNKVAADAVGSVANKPFNYGDEIELDDSKFSRPGMVQVGWKYVKEDGVTEYRYGLAGAKVDTSVFDVPSTGTIEFKALYVPSKYTVTLFANGGIYANGTTEKSVTIGYRDSTSGLEVPSRVGYNYRGYYARRGTDLEKVGSTWNFIDVTEVIASWSGINYRVVFDPNGGEGRIAPQEFTYEEVKALNSVGFTKSGYNLNNWIMETSDGRRVNVPLDYDASTLTTVDGAEIVLVANWVGKNYEVEYDRNGAPGVTVIDRATYGETYHVRGNIYNYPGYEFTGWGRSSTSIAEYFEGSELNSAYKEKET